MNEDQIRQLENEKNLGRKAEHAYEQFIEPFIDEKRQVLFEAFQAISIGEPEKLLETKRQLMAINALEDEIKLKIETGKLASKALADIEEK